MLLSLPLSFPALLIFPSNASRAATGAGGRNLREDAFILGPFFSVQQRVDVIELDQRERKEALFLSSLQLFRFCIERMA